MNIAWSTNLQRFQKLCLFTTRERENSARLKRTTIAFVVRIRSARRTLHIYIYIYTTEKINYVIGGTSAVCNNYQGLFNQPPFIHVFCHSYKHQLAQHHTSCYVFISTQVPPNGLFLFHCFLWALVRPDCNMEVPGIWILVSLSPRHANTWFYPASIE